MLSTKKDSHDLKVELLYLAGMFRALSPGASISVALRKLLQGGRGEVRLYTTLQQRKQAVWTSKVRYQVKEFSILCMGRCKPLFHMHLSYLGPIQFPCSPGFLRSPSSSAVTVEGGQGHWIAVLGALIHILRPEIADGCGISYWLIWKETFAFHSAHLKQCTAGVIQNFSNEWTANTAPSAIQVQSINKCGGLTAIVFGLIYISVPPLIYVF